MWLITNNIGGAIGVLFTYAFLIIVYVGFYRIGI